MSGPENEMQSRREFINGITAAGLLPASSGARRFNSMTIKAIVFDAFPIFDVRPVYSLGERLFLEKGAELANLWRARQFEYMWLRSLSGHYSDFSSVTADALIFAARALKLELTAQRRSLLMEAWLQLTCWPDVPTALQALSSSGLRIGFLSNMTAKMLEAGLRNCGLRDLFEQVLSTDRVRVYKPAPRAYHMAIDAFRLHRQEIAFAAFAGWDAAGAESFGYRTYWVNRQNQPAEELGVALHATGTTLTELVAYLMKSRTAQ